MKNALLVFALLVLAACTPEPPASYAIDPAMPAVQADVVRDAVRAWCESERAFCPAEKAWGDAEGKIYWSPDYARHDRQAGSCAYTERGEALIRINASRPECVEDLHVFWLVAAHEVGHLSGLDGHDHGLAVMAAKLDPTLPLVIQ